MSIGGPGLPWPSLAPALSRLRMEQRLFRVLRSEEQNAFIFGDTMQFVE